MTFNPQLIDGNNSIPDGVSIGWQDIFPDGKFCPFQQATVTPNKKASTREQVVMVRIYQPCFKEKCAFAAKCQE